MIAQCDPQAALEFLQQTKFIITQDSVQSERVHGVLSLLQEKALGFLPNPVVPG